ncbi:MAG: site-specific integrase [Clostridia bacterium]|nr:site-specific integrase [Clostridia bacterium]
MARKGENIYKRKDGRWEGRCISSYGIDGKAKYSYVYAKTYNEVKRKLSALRLSVINLTESNKSIKKKTFKDWISEWEEQKKQFVKESTLVNYENTVKNHIIPQLGEYPIALISTSLMKQFVMQKLNNGRLDGNGGLSAKTMTDILTIIKEVFKYAQCSGTQSMCNFEQITIKKSIQEMRVLTRNEENRLLTVITNNMDIYKLGVYICLFTGIRVGELCALQWRNISFSDKTLKVDHTMQRLQCGDEHGIKKTKIIVSDPKSFASVRVIPLPDFLLDMLRPFIGKANSFVLASENKEYTEPRTMQNKFKKYLKEGQIAEANFHSLRHTFATRCIELGFDVKTLSEILGHSSVKITLDRYVHSSMEQKMLNMEKLSIIA